MLCDGAEVAPIDVREELTFSLRHLLWARNVPLSRLELRFATLVPRHSTRIVLIDDGEGLAARAADVLSRAGYSDLAILVRRILSALGVPEPLVAKVASSHGKTIRLFRTP